MIPQIHIPVNNTQDTGALLKTIEENVEEYDINVKGNVV